MAGRRSLEDRKKDAENRLAIAEAKLKLARTRELSLRAKRTTEMLSRYHAAERSRLTEDWLARPTTADQSIIPDTALLNARARDLVQDDWSAASVVGTYRRHLVGTGINAKSSARDFLNDATIPAFQLFNRQIDFWWQVWGDDPMLCDVERRKTFIEMEGLAAEELPTVGQAFFIMCYKRRANAPGLMLQMFEPEQLDTLKSANPENNYEIRSGVELEPVTGAPVAFWVFVAGLDVRRTYRSERVPAERVIHVFRQGRSRQTIGVTWFAPVMLPMRHLAMYNEYQVINARFEAVPSGVIKTTTPAGAGNLFGAPEDLANSKDAFGSEEVVMEPGSYPRLRPGEEMQWDNLTRPGNQCEPFNNMTVDHVGAGVGLDGAVLRRNFTEGSFSAQREGQLERDMQTDSVKQLLVDLLLRRVRAEFKLCCILEGRAQAPGFFESHMMRHFYLADVYSGPPKRWIDPARQAAAHKIAVEQRFETVSEVLVEQGKNVEDDFHQHGYEEELARKNRITVPRSDVAPAAAPAVDRHEPRPEADHTFDESIPVPEEGRTKPAPAKATAETPAPAGSPA